MVKTLLIPALIGVIVPAQAKILKAKVATTSYTPSSFIGGWETTSTFETNGVKNAVPGADTVGEVDAWKYASYAPGISKDAISTENIAKSFSLKNNSDISIEFSVDFYNEDGTLKVGTKNGNESVDVYVFDFEQNVNLAMLRIWVNSSNTKNGNHSYDLYYDGWTPLDSTGKWIMGDALASSSFTVHFDKENLFRSKVGGGGDDLVQLVNLESDSAKALKNKLQNVDYINFKIGGDGGWAKEANVVLKSVNGQSLATTDGGFDDNVAPTFDAFSMPSSLQINQSTTLKITAHDVLSSDISYSIEYSGTRSDGLTFTPTKSGEDSVKVYAKDASGNEASKEFTFTGVDSIAAPTFNGTLPTIDSKTYDYFDTVTVAKPDVTDATGNGSVSLKYRKKAASGEAETEYASLSLNTENKFTFVIDPDFAAGDYEYYFEATNTGGTTSSSVQTATIQTTAYTAVDFVNKGDAKAIVEYENTGIKIRTREMHKNISLGDFLLDDGIKVTYHVPYKNSQGADNGVRQGGGFVDFKLVNVKNSDYSITYRVWMDQITDNHDNPTNVLVTTPGEEGEVNTENIENAGWILYGDNENYKELNLNFSMDEYFSSFDHSGNKKIAEVDGKTTISDAITAFFASAPKSRYSLVYSTGNVNGDLATEGAISSSTFEATITKINDQDLANTNGVMSKYEDMTVEISGENTAESGKEMTYGVYFKDIFKDNVAKSVKIVKPDNSEEDVTSSLTNDEFKYTFSALGEYKIVASATGSSGKTVTEELKVTVTQEKIPTTITLSGEYASTAKVGDTITILGATYSSNVNPDKCTITVVDVSNKETAVKAGDEYTFAKAGVYTIKYFASDDATPEPNTATLDVVINVPDTEKPVVNFVTNESYVKGTEVTFKVDATDDTELTYAVSVTKPDKAITKFATSEFKVTLDQVGDWSIQVKVTDLYDNETVVTKSFKVTEESKDDGKKDEGKGVNTGAIIGGVVGGVAGVGLIAAAIIIISKKRKAK